MNMNLIQYAIRILASEIALDLAESGGCDHSVGICCCDQTRLLVDAEKALFAHNDDALTNGVAWRVAVSLLTEVRAIATTVDHDLIHPEITDHTVSCWRCHLDLVSTYTADLLEKNKPPEALAARVLTGTPLCRG